jgi:hypothetical protein
MKKMICLSFLAATLTTGALAQVSTPPAARDPHAFDRSTTQTIPDRMSPSDQTGTMPDKSMGPGQTTGIDRGPDGTPGNGSPSKMNGNQQ